MALALNHTLNSVLRVLRCSLYKIKAVKKFTKIFNHQQTGRYLNHWRVFAECVILHHFCGSRIKRKSPPPTPNKGNGTFKKNTYFWQPLPCWLNEKCVYLKLLEAPPLFIPQTDSYWPSTWLSIMREFLNIRGCLAHILTLNQLMLSPISSSSHSSGLSCTEVTQLSALGWSKELAYTMSCSWRSVDSLKMPPPLVASNSLHLAAVGDS